MEEHKREASPAVEMQDMLAMITQLRAELDNLKSKTQALPQPAPLTSSKPEISTTRRKLLRRLAGGLAAGLAVGGIGASLPQQAEAKLITGKGVGIGAVVVPPGGTFDGVLPNNTVYGLYATSDMATNVTPYSPNFKMGVVGLNTTSNDYSSIFYGVYGEAKDAGVYGKAFGPGSFGVYGTASGSGNIGVYGYSTTGDGVTGFSSNGYGIHGKSPSGFAGYFDGTVIVDGNLTVYGNLSKSSGSFKIDHPLDPANKYLYHSFVESPDMKNIYDGLVTLDGQGEATIEMPDWFDALNFDFRYQLTALDSASPNLHISSRLKDKWFKISGGQPGQEVSWQVTGIRQDVWAKAKRIPVEETKTGEDKGKYLHPELFGQPTEMRVGPKPPDTK